ncbi:MAG: adenylate/guanylate cyclase domain-containing protein [Gammaproteobacteria bacterium]|nr:adenylate/guanylate cyclase domain-containing protein [Gammaproteobacteria bacterium]
MTPETHFAENDGVNIAYQVFGEGPGDLVFIHGLFSNLDLLWEEPRVARFLLALGRLARVILIDRRGTGLSDRVTPPTFEEQMDDIRTVMDAAGSGEACFLGYSEGGCMGALFAATHPERTSSLITIGSYARWAEDEGFPHGTPRKEIEDWFEILEREWGEAVSIEYTSPTLANDEQYRHWLAKFYRSSANKKDALALMKTALDMDLRAILPTISAPALVLQATRDLVTPLESGRDFANRIPGAQLVEIDSDDHSPWASCNDDILREIGRFLGETSGTRVIDRVLATVLFTDIVDSTKLAAEMGDQKWSDLLEEHHKMIRHELEIFHGHEVKTTGDGFHATFDGPARAIHCADAIRNSTRQLGLNLRIGIHIGECEKRGEVLEGVAIHIAARVSAMASGGDILVSRTVKDLVAGSGIEFEDFGTHALKGIPDEHQIFRVTYA